MQMETERNVAEQGVKPFLGRWRPFTVQHLKCFCSQTFQNTSPQAPIIAKKMGKFVGYREPLFRIAVGPIDKSDSMAAPRHEARSQGAILTRQFTH
jgi:hypothetical protein